MRSTFALSALLLLSLACSGGSGGSSDAGSPTTPPSQGPALTYIDPTTGDYRLVRNSTLSTATHLVLDITGAGGPNATGFAFSLSVDATNRAAWSKVAPVDPEPFQNGTVFANGAAFSIKGKGSASSLAGVLGLKGPTFIPSLNGTIARVALDLAPGASAGPVVLSAPKVQVLLSSSSIQTVTLAVGTLAVK